MDSQQQQALLEENIYKDMLYKLAKAIRNVEGKSPSSIGPEIGQILCALRCLDGERYDREVLLCTGVKLVSTTSGTPKVIDTIEVGRQND